MDRKEYLKARIMEGMGKKSGTKPMSDKEKSLAALAHPKDKITHKDVLVGRGVLKKEEVEQVEEGSTKSYNKYKKRMHQAAQSATKVKPMGNTQLTRAAAVKMTRDAMKKEEVEQVDIVESLEKPKTIKVTTKNGWNFDGLIKVTGSDYHIVKHPVTGKQYRVDKSGNSIEEEVEQVDEGNKENKAKKNTYVANIIKKKLSSQVLPSLKFGRRELKKEEVEQVDEIDRSQPAAGRDSDRPYPTKPIKLTDKQRTSAKLMTRELLKHAKKQLKKEEVEQIDELKKGTLMSYVGKAREKNIKDSAKNRLAGTETSLSDIDKQQAKVSKRSKGIQRAYTRLNKEEVEQIGEAIRVTTLNSRSYGHPEDTPKGSPQRKRLASQFKKIKNDTKNKSTFGVQARKYMKPGDSVHYGDVGIAKEEVEQVNEASYSAKSARAGKDIGKPGKMFAKIAASASKKYGSEERGKKVAGAVLKKLRAKQAK